MGKTLIGVIAVLCVGCGGEEEVPGCQQALTNFYGVGCTFVNLQTNQPYTLNESILSCQEVNAAVPDRCQVYFDDYMFCLDAVSSSARCVDCSDEQDALFGCD